MTVPITVVVPVGPSPDACAYLGECIVSVVAQNTGLLLVDDMHGLGWHGDCTDALESWPPNGAPKVHRNAWNLGVAASFNVGVAMAPTEHVLLLGADDYLEPDAIAAAQRAIEAHPYTSAYYYFGVRYLDDRPNPLQTAACGAAVVTKGLWRETGGFPVESAVGRPDTMLVGLLMSRPDVGALVPIEDGAPLYNVRIHAGQHTASRGPWVPALEATAQAFWSTWSAPVWGRYE